MKQSAIYATPQSSFSLLEVGFNQEMSESLDFSLPGHIRDFIFDLHQSTRVATNSEDVVQYYEVRYKELTDKYFAQSAWPDTKAVSGDCGGDEDFLLFYKYVICDRVSDIS